MPQVTLVFRDDLGWCVDIDGPKGHSVSLPILEYLTRLHEFHCIELPMFGPTPQFFKNERTVVKHKRKFFKNGRKRKKRKRRWPGAKKKSAR